MTKKPKYLEDFNALHRAQPSLSHLLAIEDELYANSSDRAVAVVFGSLVEANLESLLKTVFRADLNSDDRSALFGFDGPVGTFSSKILVGYGLSLFGPQTRRELDLIRHIRNGFAHSRIPFNFTTPEVSAVCAEFKIVNFWGAHIPQGYLQKVPHDKLEEASNINHPKTRFITTCHHLSYRMMVKRDGPAAGDIAFPDNEPLP